MYITFDVVPFTLFLYYAHLVIRKLLATSSFFISDPLTQEQERHPSLSVVKKLSLQNYLSIDI